MTAQALLTDLSARGVVVTIAGDSLELDAPAGVLSRDDIASLRMSKNDIMDVLKSRCRPHNNADNHRDEPDGRRHGWIRSTCRICGRFVGYRQVSRYTQHRSG